MLKALACVVFLSFFRLIFLPIKQLFYKLTGKRGTIEFNKIKSRKVFNSHKSDEYTEYTYDVTLKAEGETFRSEYVNHVKLSGERYIPEGTVKDIYLKLYKNNECKYIIISENISGIKFSLISFFISLAIFILLYWLFSKII